MSPPYKYPWLGARLPWEDYEASVKQHTVNTPYAKPQALEFAAYDRLINVLASQKEENSRIWSLGGSAALAKHLKLFRRINDLDFSYRGESIESAVVDIDNLFKSVTDDIFRYQIMKDPKKPLGKVLHLWSRYFLENKYVGS